MQPRETVHELYDAYRTRNEARLRELMADDIEWNQCAGFPGGSKRRGIDDVLDGILGSNHSIWTDFGADTNEFLVDGESVVVLGSYRGKHAHTGKEMQADFVHVYRVRDGKVTRFDQVADTAPMIAAMSEG